MADEGRKKAERAVAELLSTKANKPDLVPALVGAYVNGQKTLVVDGRPDYLWVRLHGNTSEPIKAFNGEAGVGPHWDLPILVYRDEIHPNVWKVWGRDIRVYQSWGGTSYLTKHGFTHSFGGSGSIGNDVAWIYKRQWMPLLPRPNATGTMAIYVEPGFYFTGDQYQYWPGSGTADLTGNKPTGAFNGNFVTVYLDSNTTSLAYLKGPELNVYAPPFDPGEHIGVPPLGTSTPLAAVWLVTGTSDIGWFDIYDLRATEHVQADTLVVASAHHSLSITYMSGTGTAGADASAVTLMTLTLPANTLTQIKDRIRVKTYWRGDIGDPITGTVRVNGVIVSDTTDSGAVSLQLNESWLHYIDNTHANIVEHEAGALGANSAANVAGFDWDSDQSITFAQNSAVNNHAVLFAVIVDVLPKGEV